jgi:hypothetical protein
MRTQRGSSASALPPQPPIPHTPRISPRQFFQSSDCGERVSASDLQSTRSPASSNPYRVPVPTGRKNRFRPVLRKNGARRCARLAGDAGESSKHLSSERSNCSLQAPVAPLGVCVPCRLADRDGTDGWMITSLERNAGWLSLARQAYCSKTKRTGEQAQRHRDTVRTTVCNNESSADPWLPPSQLHRSDGGRGTDVAVDSVSPRWNAAVNQPPEPVISCWRCRQESPLISRPICATRTARTRPRPGRPRAWPRLALPSVISASDTRSRMP